MDEDLNQNGNDTIKDIMAQLAGQSATAVVEYLGPDSFFEKLDEAAARAQYDNVVAHIRNVIDALGKIPKLTAAQTIRIRSWAKVARDISPTDEALSAIVEAALHDILSSAEASPYQEAAGKLNNTSARQLLIASANDTFEPEHQKDQTLRELAAVDLISRPTRANLFGQFCASIAGALLGAIVLVELILPYGAALLPRRIPTSLGLDLIIDAAVIGMLFTVVQLLGHAQRYWLTEFGKSTQQAAQPFLQEVKAPNKRWPLISILYRPLTGAITLTLAVCILPLVLQFLPKELRYLQEPAVVVLTPAPTPISSPVAVPSTPTGLAEPPPTQITLPAENISKLIDAWKSVSAQLENTIRLPETLSEIMEKWQRSVNAIKQNVSDPVEQQQQFQNAAGALGQDLSGYRNRFLSRRVSLGNLASTYASYPNISNTLDAKTVDQKFNRYAGALENLRNELSITPNPFGVSSAIALKPFQEEVEDTLKDLTTWASQTRDFADKQIKELSKAVRP